MMRLQRLSARHAGLALAALLLPSSAAAHEEHRKPITEQNETQAASGARDAATRGTEPMAMHRATGEAMEPKQDRSSMSFAARLLDWFGRLHPSMVHFPIAFFPAALFAALVARRRPALEAPVRFLVIAGGIIAPIAAILGWLDALSAEPSALLDVHRWLGTALGVGGLALALWAWRRPEASRGTGMLVTLAAITAAIVIQGWYGGALVHGIEHLNW